MMKRRWIATALILALLVVPAPAAARGANVFHFGGYGISAVFSTTAGDASGCVATNVFVFGGGGLGHGPPGPPMAHATGIAVNLFIFDACANIILLDALGGKDMSPEEFQIANDLKSATLNASIPVRDQLSGTSFDLAVHLIWTATSEPSHNREHNHVHLPGICIDNDFYRSTIRDAVVSGMVSDGATNFTPEPALGGLVLSTDSSRVTLGDCSEE